MSAPETAAVSSWRIPIRLTEVPEDGLHLQLDADAPTRTAIAAMAGVVDISRLTAHLDIERRGRDGIWVKGEVAATVHQLCVVTLEPIESHIREPVSAAFAPPKARVPVLEDVEEAVLAVDGDDPPEPLLDGAADLGTLMTEFLLLAVDPYPRKTGAEFAPPQSPPEPGGGAFAALAALKKDDPSAS